MPGTGERKRGRPGSLSFGASGPSGKTDMSNEGQVQNRGNLQQGFLTEPERSGKASERR